MITALAVIIDLLITDYTELSSLFESVLGLKQDYPSLFPLPDDSFPVPSIIIKPFNIWSSNSLPSEEKCI